MVSPPSSSSRPPPLSYADRAKKAQNIKSPISPTSQRAKPFGKVAPLSPVSHAPSGAFISSADASPVADVPLTSLAGPLLAPAPSSPTRPLTDESGAQSTNGDGSIHDSASTAPSTAPSQTGSSKAAPVNVWNQRKEQLAQARTQSRPLQALSQNVAPGVQTSPRYQVNGASVASGSRPDVPSATAARIQKTATPPDGNGKQGSTVSSPDDAFVVRVPRSTSGPPPPPVDDVESWPEVGKASLPTSKTQSVNNSHASSAEEKEELGKEEENSSPNQPASPRKSEKIKWVSIPREELQAAADALQASQQRSQPHSRSQSQVNSPRRHQPRSNIVSGAGSLQGSQVPSKAPSVRTSATHSRIQSPTGSVQSSPRNLNRGRRLPAEDLAGPSTSTGALEPPYRPSQGNSPRVYAETTFAAPVPSISINRDVYSFGSFPSHVNNPTTYYVPHPHPQSIHTSPNQVPSQHPPSPADNFHQPYTLHTPPNGYANPPSNVPLMQQNYSGPPSYPVYPSYGYSYPYMYWNGAPPRNDFPAGSHYSQYPLAQVPPAAPSQPPAPGSEPEFEANLPPPTMIARPPHPQSSDAVAGYREVVPTQPPNQDGTGDVVVRGRLARDVVFGSIDVPGGSQMSSPAPQAAKAVDAPNEGTEEGPKEAGERTAITFSIGVAPGEAGPSHVRSRTRSQPRLQTDVTSVGDQVQLQQVAEVKVVDLTDSETKWEFGTTKHDGEDGNVDNATAPQAVSPSRSAASPKETHTLSEALRRLQPGEAGRDAHPYTLKGQEAAIGPLQLPPTEFHPGPQWQSYHQLPTPPNGLQLQTGVGPYPLQPTSAQPPTGSSLDEFEVKDFGWGFGRGSSTGVVHPVSGHRDDRPVRGDWGRSEGHDMYGGRPRRGSYSTYSERGGYAGERGGYEPRGGFDYRGGYSGRRGRGINGYGRGYSSRGYGRGGSFYHRSHPPQPPPFTITPPAPAYQPLAHPPTPPHTDVHQYFSPPQQYVPQGYEYQHYQSGLAPNPPAAPVQPQVPAPPISRPMSNVPYLDPTRFFLLGQLEYYLSAQNLAQDLFLRKKMDSRGWIPIQLLASFPRVQQMTQDAQLVREAVALSHVLEVRGGYVRGREWQQFVLPDAVPSTVEPEVDPHQYQYQGGEEADGDEEEEEEEDEVEFVMGQVGQPWLTSS